ncbi:hypothetical protein Pflav_083400 [Phytohabitans flavus]|uniref:Uncharacterized protein n=1 Tax=Phytohabitans flavus TaxID=1076124 RepID=A0A6F8Y791_9ACTN|nr:hypothetical protein Pflav_083400 [Phytohabitans flavus]
MDRARRESWTVGFSGSFSTAYGHRKSFHVVMNVSRPSTAAAGRRAGATTLRKMRKVPHPSIRAASISSSDTAWLAYCRIMKTPKPVTSAGTITACSRSFQPRSVISMYSGITPSCVGTIMVAMITSSSALEPRKRSLAKAKPASEEKNTTEMVTEPATIAELIMPVRKWASALAKSRSTLPGRLPPGVTGGGTWPIASLDRVATTNIQ